MIKTVSLETAKLLKDAGFKQNCEKEINVIGGYNYPENMVALPTTDELLEELPCEGGKCQDWLNISKLDGDRGYSCGYGYPEYSSGEFTDKSLPEALAQMWIYLKKEGIL